VLALAVVFPNTIRWINRTNTRERACQGYDNPATRTADVAAIYVRETFSSEPKGKGPEDVVLPVDEMYSLKTKKTKAKLSEASH
jgi:hypothetical protein